MLLSRVILKINILAEVYNFIIYRIFYNISNRILFHYNNAKFQISLQSRQKLLQLDWDVCVTSLIVYARHSPFRFWTMDTTLITKRPSMDT